MQARRTVFHRRQLRHSAWLLACFLLSCEVYDPSLFRGPDGAQVEDAGSSYGGNDAEVVADVDSGIEQGCVSQEDPDCPQRCPETCNGHDDDCDGATDEGDAAGLCDLHFATGVCVAGSCVIASCDAGHVDCDELAADGCEATLDSVDHCGLCGQRCALAHAEPACNGGSCQVFACAPLFGDCDQRADDGCERPLSTLNDCGACGAGCAAAHAITDCSQGRCTFSKCSPGYGDCNHDADKLGSGDGCETELTSPAHCGSCEQQCSGSLLCSGGKCTSAKCDTDTADCDGNNMLCETSLHTLDNCGACGTQCESAANASASCSSGSCTQTCSPGFASCDNALANGCETDVRTNTNCGACGNTCTYANAASSCVSGSCQLTACGTGYGNCNGMAADGCEQRLNSTVHCGACGQACTLANAVATCGSGSCAVSSCNSGFGNCDGNAANGCETNLSTSAQNCNACGQACTGGFSCQSRRCVCTSNSNCSGGQVCCNGACVTTSSDEANCGSCGKACGASQTCCSGNCKTLSSDIDNCGSCGNACDSNANTCNNGQCRCASDSPCSGISRCCANGCRLGVICF